MTVKERREEVQEMVKNKPYNDSEYSKVHRRIIIRSAFNMCIVHRDMEFFYDMLNCTKVEELKEMLEWDEQRSKIAGRPFRTTIRKYLRELK